MSSSSQSITQIQGIICVKPKGTLYLFAEIDNKKFNITNDEKFVLDFLKEKKVLLVYGREFNWVKPEHFRLVFLLHRETLQSAHLAIFCKVINNKIG